MTAKRKKDSKPETAKAMPSLLEMYFREIGRFPLLTAEEERDLARSMAAGSDGARERLIVSNLRLVAKIAQDYAETGLPLGDLIQEGNVGLIEAIDRFDPERGYRLSTYAAYWIRRSMLTAINNSARMIRIPDYLFRAVRRMAQMRSMGEDGGADEAEITEAVGLSIDALRRIEAQVNEIASLDQLVGDDGGEPLEERIADETGLSPEHEALRMLFRDELSAVLEGLPARQAFAIRLHYGIEDGCPYNLADIGRIMKVSRERARQLVRDGMKRLSSQWGERALEYYRDLLRDG